MAEKEKLPLQVVHNLLDNGYVDLADPQGSRLVIQVETPDGAGRSKPDTFLFNRLRELGIEGDIRRFEEWRGYGADGSGTGDERKYTVSAYFDLGKLQEQVPDRVAGMIALAQTNEAVKRI